MEQQTKRPRGRPRKHPVPSDAISSLAGKTLRDPEATKEEKSLAAMVLNADPVEGPNDENERYFQPVANTENDDVSSKALSPDEGAICDVRNTKSGRAHEVPRGQIAGSEIETLKREAWEAFDYQVGRGKTDTLGRIWGFEPETRNGNTVVTFSLRRLGGERVERVVSTSQYGMDGARQMSDAMVEEMNGVLA